MDKAALKLKYGRTIETHCHRGRERGPPNGRGIKMQFKHVTPDFDRPVAIRARPSRGHERGSMDMLEGPVRRSMPLTTEQRKCE